MIEKKIHYCWFGKGPIPEKDRKCIESWGKYCPDYEIIEWNEDNYDVTKCEYMRMAYENKKWGFVPDYARLDIIYNEGGIYLDTDVELIKSLDDLLELKGFCGFEKKERVAMGLGFGAEKGNETIKRMRDMYDEISFLNDDGSLNLVASPFYTTKILKEEGLQLNGKLQMIKGIKVFPTEYFAPLTFANNKLKITSNTYSIHWFNASWHTEEQRKIMERVQKVNRIFGLHLGRIVNKAWNVVHHLKKQKS